MKKIALIAVVAAVALTGCAQIERDQVDMQPSKTPISFSAPVMAPTTRTPVTGEAPANTTDGYYSTKSHFTVSAVWTKGAFSTWTGGTTYMDQVPTKHVSQPLNNGAWHPCDASFTEQVVYYWPKDGKLTFAAYSPSEMKDNATSVTYSDAGLQIVGFKVPDLGYVNAKEDMTAGTQYDLMYSDLVKDKVSGTTEDTHYNGLDINFKHALSSIKFTIRTKADYAASNYEIKIKSLNISGIVGSGDFNQNVESVAAWTPVPGSANENVKSYEVINIASDNLVPYAATSSGSKGLSTYTGGKDLILLPQDLDETKIATIVWSMKKTGGQEIEQTSKLKLKIEPTSSPSTPGIVKWEMGKRYIYNIVIGLDEIYFNPIVEAWDDASSSDVTV